MGKSRFYGDREYKISVGGVSYESYYSGRNIGATLIVSQNYLKSLAPEPYVLSLIIKYEESYDETVETEILEKLEQHIPNISYRTYYRKRIWR